MIHLMYCDVALESATKLAAFMGIEASTNAPPKRPAWLIRYGSRRKVPLKPSHGVINSLSSFSHYKTRLDQLTILSAAGIRVPFFDSKPIISWTSAVLARDFPTGEQPTGGKNITLYPAGSLQPTTHSMYMVLIEKSRQFRVHVISGAARIREVLPSPTRPVVSSPIWSWDNGYSFLPSPTPIPPTVGPLGVAAVAALGLDFGAVDIGLSADYGVPFVFEVNTAPGLVGQGDLEWYAKRLGQSVGLPYHTMPGVQPNV